MNTNELYDLISNNKECNFVATQGSVLQINCVNAAIEALQDKGIKLHGYIIRLTSETLSMQTYKKNYQLEDDNIKYIDDCKSISYGSSKERLTVFLYALKRKKHNNNFYIIGADLIHPIYYAVYKAYGKKKNIVYVEIDDGLTNYISVLKNRLLNYKIKNNGSNIIELKEKFIQLGKVISIKILDKIVKWNGFYIDMRLLSDRKKTIKRNKEIDKYFITIAKRNCIDKRNRNDYSHIKNKVLFVGNYVDNIDSTVLFLNNMCKKGLKVVYKPHPREKKTERLKKIQCETMKETDIALEVLLSDYDNRPYFIVGDFSSVLCYAKPYFGIEAICYKSIKEYQVDSIDVGYLKMFKNKFNRVVFFPNSEEELIAYIKSKYWR